MKNSYFSSKKVGSIVSGIFIVIIIFWNIYLLISCIVGTNYCKEVVAREQEDEGRGKPTTRYDLY